MKYAEGLATGVRFGLLLDMPCSVELSPVTVAALCSRGRGLGVDGVLRVTVAGSAREAGILDELPEGVTVDDWYIDQRDADGALEAFDGNGLRMLSHYLWAAGLERRREFVAGSRTHAHSVQMHSTDAASADISVVTAGISVRGRGAARITGREFDAVRLDISGDCCLAGVSPTLSAEDLLELDMKAPIAFDDGASGESAMVAFASRLVDDAVAMRVHRDGELPSSDLAAVAVACAARPISQGTLVATTVRAAGGTVTVGLAGTTCRVRGSTSLTAHGDIPVAWLRRPYPNWTSVSYR